MMLRDGKVGEGSNIAAGKNRDHFLFPSQRVEIPQYRGDTSYSHSDL